jgi:hypothetical protein
MALKNSKNYQPEMERNESTDGLIKIGQIQLVGIATAPTTNLDNGRAYYNSTTNALMVYVNSGWQTVTLA